MPLSALRRPAAAVAAAAPALALALWTGPPVLPLGGADDRVRTEAVDGDLGVEPPASGPTPFEGAHPVSRPTGLMVVPAVEKEGAPPDFSDTAVPAQVLQAYRSAARVLARSDPGCNLSWALLAGVGKVESGHAYGGAVDRRGDTLTPILGPVLDGGPGVAAIPDTDDGRWDTHRVWDRAVGPMQFIPSSWVLHGVDGNGDRRRDPSNVLDATLAAGWYLCAGERNLSQERDRRGAVFSYNHSRPYVDLVLAWADAYANGVDVLTGSLRMFSAHRSSGGDGKRSDRKRDPAETTSATAAASTTAATTEPPSPSSPPRPSEDPTCATPSPTPTDGSGSPEPTSSPTASPSGSGSPDPTTGTSPEPCPTASPSATGTP